MCIGCVQFAFVALGILPFMAFGEYVQNAQMIGEDEGDIEKTAVESSEGAVVVETLVNIRVVASLSMEEKRVGTYSDALKRKSKKSTLLGNTIKGSGQGLGSFFQMWGKFEALGHFLTNSVVSYCVSKRRFFSVQVMRLCFTSEVG